VVEKKREIIIRETRLRKNEESWIAHYRGAGLMGIREHGLPSSTGRFRILEGGA